jgi:hypothetical protein
MRTVYQIAGAVPPAQVNQVIKHVETTVIYQTTLVSPPSAPPAPPATAGAPAISVKLRGRGYPLRRAGNSGSMGLDNPDTPGSCFMDNDDYA